MSRNISLYDAKTRFSEVIDRVEAGSEYVVTRNGIPCARLVPFRKPKKVPLGFVEGVISDSFFEPLPEAELASWEGRIAPGAVRRGKRGHRR